MTNASKNKGKGFEREVCKIMEEHFGGSWQRTFTSGGFTGGANLWRAQVLSKSQLLNNSNDVVPPDEYPHASLECKFYKDFDFHHLFRPEGNTTLNDWIEQVEVSGINMDVDFPMIVMKFNRKGIYCCIWKDKFNDVDYSKVSHMCYRYKDKDFLIFELDTVLQHFVDNLKEKFA